MNHKRIIQKENEYYQRLEERIQDQNFERQLELDAWVYISNMPGGFEKQYFQKYYANMENGNSRKFDSPLDYMNCILEETLHHYRGRK
jgi:hypothetical protein